MQLCLGRRRRHGTLCPPSFGSLSDALNRIFFQIFFLRHPGTLVVCPVVVCVIAVDCRRHLGKLN